MTVQQILWIASGNTAKVRELADFATRLFPKMHILSREPRNAIESENTFLGNARLKAQALAQELLSEGQIQFSVLGDDSGLSVDLLEGRPGIFSARYSGAGSNSRANLEKVLSEVNSLSMDLEERTAQYNCALYFIEVVDGKIRREYASEGNRQGIIGIRPKGPEGYAYDSIFLDPESLLSYGEISYAEKQIDSHRARAFAKLSEQMEPFA